MNDEPKGAPALPEPQPQTPPKPPWWAVAGLAVSFAVAIWGFSTRRGAFSIAACVVIWLIVAAIAFGSATLYGYRASRNGEEHRPRSLGDWLRLGFDTARERISAATGTGAGVLMPIVAAVLGLTVMVIVKDIVIG